MTKFSQEDTVYLGLFQYFMFSIQEFHMFCSDTFCQGMSEK